ncbi:MAG: hypothetical protein DWI58_12635 [Chloroflexi bacterium]|nr:MAG: hypothetical protein DWI58_12635 [Chloroflexota bacterium]
MSDGVRDEILDLIRRDGPITFDRFQELCLYSKNGFYSSRTRPIGTTFHTAPTTHHAFGELIAKQLDEMWRLMDEPPIFHAVEVGSGDGALARSIMHACVTRFPRFAQALRYVASDYAPVWPDESLYLEDLDALQPSTPIQRVRAEGISAFRSVHGCILSNELLDNFTVHRFEMQNGQPREIFVTAGPDGFVEVLAEPSTPRITERLAGVALPDGQHGEVSLAIEGWTDRVAKVLERGFVLTIDYGQLASDLYSAKNPNGTLRCFKDHIHSNDWYEHIGEQDITSDVDFSALMMAGERRGLASVGYSTQGDFLTHLGFDDLIEELHNSGLSAARTSLREAAMMALVDEEEMGDFKVLVQSKGMPAGIQLSGFAPK